MFERSNRSAAREASDIKASSVVRKVSSPRDCWSMRVAISTLRSFSSRAFLSYSSCEIRRPAEVDSEPTDPLEFVINADGVFSGFDEVRLQGTTVSGIRCYLTGQAQEDGGFDVQRFRIRDKHGFDHFVDNQKFNIHLSGDGASADALYLGRRHSDLTEFDGLKVAVT